MQDISINISQSEAEILRAAIDRQIADSTEDETDGKSRLLLKKFSVALETSLSDAKTVKPRSDYNIVPWPGFKNLRGEKSRSIRNAFCRMAANILLENGGGMKGREILAKADSSLNRLYQGMDRDIPAMVSSHFLNAVRKHSQFCSPSRGVFDLTAEAKQIAGVGAVDNGYLAMAGMKRLEQVLAAKGIYDIAGDADNARIRLTRSGLVEKTAKVVAAAKESRQLGLEYRDKSYGKAQALFFFGAALHDIFCLRPKTCMDENREFACEMFMAVAGACGFKKDWNVRSWKQFSTGNNILRWRFQGLHAFLDENGGGK